MIFPVGEDREGGGTAAGTLDVKTPCRASRKVWREESERPRATRPAAGGGITDCPPPPSGPNPLTVSFVWVGGVAEE